MATPHNEAERGDFADIVLMPGDPMSIPESFKRSFYSCDISVVVCSPNVN